MTLEIFETTGNIPSKPILCQKYFQCFRSISSGARLIWLRWFALTGGEEEGWFLPVLKSFTQMSVCISGGNLLWNNVSVKFELRTHCSQTRRRIVKWNWNWMLPEISEWEKIQRYLNSVKFIVIRKSYFSRWRVGNSRNLWWGLLKNFKWEKILVITLWMLNLLRVLLC